MTEHTFSMKPLTPPFSPSDRQALRARLLVDRPLHWDLARALLAALELAWDRLERLEATTHRPVVNPAPAIAPSEVRAPDARPIVDQGRCA
jgi:hypothetical protein